MPHAFVQQKHNSSLSSVSSLGTGALSQALAGANLAEAWVIYFGPQRAVTLSGAGGQTWNAETPYGDADSGFVHPFYAENINGGSSAELVATFRDLATNTALQVVDFPAIYIAEHSGLATSSARLAFVGQIDSTGSTATDATATAGLGTLATQPAVVVGLANNAGGDTTPAAGTGFTARPAVFDYGGGTPTGRPQYQRVTSTASIPLTWTAGSAQNHAVGGWAFAEAAGGDTTAPVLTSPTGTATGSSTATVGATTDEGNGTLYAVVDTVTTTPSQAELENGLDGDGGAATWDDSQVISSTGVKTFNVTGLAPNTQYSYFIGHKDAAGNFSNIVSGTFTTFQRAAPASDVSAGGWTASSGSDLFAMIDEASPSDADYIRTSTPADVCTVALGSLSDPSASTGHKISYRIGGDGVSGIQVDLLQNTTAIASWTHDPAPATPTTFTQTLSGAEADSITNYAALRLRFTEI